MDNHALGHLKEINLNFIRTALGWYWASARQSPHAGGTCQQRETVELALALELEGAELIPSPLHLQVVDLSKPLNLLICKTNNISLLI